MEVPIGLDPTFYQTGSYEGDKEIADRVKEIKREVDNATG